MPLLQDIWTKVAAFSSLFNLSPLQHANQAPFQVPSRIYSSGQKGPIFQPPGVPDDLGFKCEYPGMIGWEPCSTSTNRKCWLRNPTTGEQFDINTNYEVYSPTGITRYYNLTLEDSYYDADGLSFNSAKLFKLAGADDNEYPGPWIQACWGDTIIVNVTNNLRYNGTSVHWHGIRQLNTTHMDGVNGVTQCPIAPGDHFAYKFNASQYGSSWYHSHYSVQYADGAAGGMTLHGPASADFDEAISPPLIMTDWSHDTAFIAVETDHLDKPDILLNGRGNITRYSRNIPNETAIKSPYTITFEGHQRGQRIKRYLIRIINTSFETTFLFSIDNHLLQIVSADFVPIQPYSPPTNTVLIGIGQRYNIIVEANPVDRPGPLSEDGNYWIRTQVPKNCMGKPGDDGYERTGILRYDSSSTANPTSLPWKKNENVNECKDEPAVDLRPIVCWEVPPPFQIEEERKKTIDLDSSVSGASDYPLAFWSLTDKSIFSPLRVNYSDPTFLHLDNKGPWANLSNVIELDGTSKDWAYLVMKSITFGAHPIHLHGHDFAILEQAYEKEFNPTTLNLTLSNPARRDVVLLPESGYVVIAFKTDNPGPWLVHCHIAFHISGGLGLQIMEDQAEANGIWPKGHSPAINETKRVCKNWEDWYGAGNHTNWAVKPWDAPCQTPEIKDRPEWCFQEDSGV